MALYSILASLLLMTAKGVVGLLTGSLAILTDTLDSFLDLSAAFITYLAVGISEKPADREHHFGHAKVESLAALAQVALLVITCFLIIREAVIRLAAGNYRIDLNVWAFVVVLGGIAVNLARVQALRGVARRYRSQALEANALNFATDILSSLLVLASLGAVYLGAKWADPLAAIGVTVFISIAMARMAKKALDVLLDRAPRETEETIRRIAAEFPEVLKVERMRLRTDGRTVFADLLLGIERSLSFALAEELKMRMYERFQSELSDVDVTVSLIPASHESENVADAVRYVVSSFALSLHHLIIKPEEGGFFVSMHVEMPGDVRLDDAHRYVTDITKRLHDSIPNLRKVVIHTEPFEETCPVREGGPDIEIDRVAGKVKEIVESFPGVKDCHNIVLTRHADGLALSADMRLDGGLPLEETHDKSERVEQKLKLEIKELVSVTLHLEPFK